MSVEAQVAQLESLLARIAENRHPMPTRSAATAAPASSALPSRAEVTVAASSPAPFEPVEPDARRPARSVPTPMEQALSFELGARDEEVEILVDHEDDEEPELSIDLEPVSQERPTGADAPTAPVGTRAPLSLDAPTAPIGTPAARAAKPSDDAAQELSAPGPSPIRIARTEAGAAVARVVAPARARTFGELLERTLALRPR